MRHLKFVILSSLLLPFTAPAQVNNDSLSARVEKISRLVQVLRDLRILVYVQPEFQVTDTNGALSFAGGDFPTNSNNRFTLRRGRLKVAYEHSNTKGLKILDLAFMFDATERGFVIKEAYGKVVDPWIGWFGLQVGSNNRPFGYEISHTPSLRETPEFARMSQVLFPGEVDIGATLVVESPTTFKPVYLRLDAGAYNGLGSNVLEFDRRKDFIGHLQARKTFGDKLKFTIWGGASYYYGGVMQSTPFVYQLKSTNNGGFIYGRDTDSAGVNKKYFKREYYGADLQISLDYKIGTTQLRGEFIAGQQPGTAASPTVPVAPGSDLYLRKFNGAYFTFVQTFKHKLKTQTICHDIVLRYDWYDPDARLKGHALSSINDVFESRADIKYQTIGVGYIFRPYDWFKLMVYYDIVKNETTDVIGYTRDLKDNVLTIRTQFMFDSNWFKK